jgi:hypothetical protein
MPKLIRFPASILACSLATLVLMSTTSATAAEGDPITPTQKKYVSNGEYGIRSDDFGVSVLNRGAADRTPAPGPS